MKKIFILLSILSLLVSCRKELSESKRLISLEPFEQIELNSAFDLFISEGNDYCIEIVGDEKIIGYVKEDIENKILKIKNTRKFKLISPQKNKIEIYVTSPPLKKIIATGGTCIKTLTPITSESFGLVLTGKASEANLELNSKSFYFWNNFPTGGKLTLSGKTEILKIWNFAIMSVNAKSLIAKNVLVENNSQGDCQVTVLNKLEYLITEVGDIHLYGKPSEIISRGELSSGKLIRH